MSRLVLTLKPWERGCVQNKESDELADLSAIETSHGHVKRGGVVPLRPNSEDTITWFDSLTNKDRLSFLSFDIVEFYPSITESLLDRAIAWGQQFTAISDSDIRIVKHARKSLLFYN